MASRLTTPLLITMVIALLCFCAIIYYNTGRVAVLDVSEMSVNATNIHYQIELVDHSSDCLDIRGWALIHGESIDTYNMHVVLKGQDGKAVYYQIPTHMVMRPDVTTVFASSETDDNPDYDMAGFASRIWLNRLKHLSGKNYAICLAYRNNGHNILIETPEVLTLR